MTSAQYMEEVNIVSSNTHNVSGWDANSAKAESNEQNAALKFSGVYGVVNYYSGGAVYFLDEESEIYESLNIYGANPYSLRITDALVNTITFPTLGNNPTTYIFTTGSAAIKHLQENGNKVKIKAYWTGKRLTRHAVNAGYEGSKVFDDYYGIDQKTAGVIYTAAQLQGMGMAEDKYAYTISPKVESIWLGGIDWPWIGAEIEKLTGASWWNDSEDPYGYNQQNSNYFESYTYRTGSGEKITKAFSLDGRNVELKNMILDIYDPNIELPGCCGTTQKVRLLNNLGLIRSIRTTKTVDIFNIQLDDVLLDTHGFAIDNVGSLVGIIDSEGDVTIGGKKDGETKSHFTDIRIVSKGNNIGGVIGELECAAAVSIHAVDVESIENNNNYINGGHIIGKSNVGGVVGRITYDEAYKGSDPSFAVTKYTTEPKGYEKLTMGTNNSGKWVTTKKGLIPATGEGAYSKLDFFTKKAHVNEDGTRTYTYENVGIADEFPAENVVYYAFFDGSDVIQEVGTITAGTDDSFKLSGSSDNWDNTPKVTNTVKVAFPIISSSDPDDWSYPDVYVKEGDTYVEANLSKTNKPEEGKTYYYDFGTNKYVIDNSASTENDYPTSLEIRATKVSLNPRTERGSIRGENGNNVGGMVGDVLLNGPANVYEYISVTVPIISATTPETVSKVNSALTKYGNNVGGLIGQFVDLTNKQASNFGGLIKAQDRISADGQRVGGVLGLQQVASTETTNELNQVTIGNASDISVEIGLLSAENGWAGGLVGLQEEGSLLINGNPKTKVGVNITKLTGANCIGGMIGENTAVTIISNDNNNSVSIANVAITKTAPYYTRTIDNKENQAGSLYLGTVGTLVGQKNGTLNIKKSEKLTVSPADGFSDKQKDALLFGLHGSAATTEITPNTYKYWGDSNKGYVGYAKMTANYSIDGTQQGNYAFNIEKEY
jgi:hypothetical protein